MTTSSPFRKKAAAAGITLAVAAIIAVAALKSKWGVAQANAKSAAPSQTPGAPQAEAALDLSPSQLQSIKIEPVGEYRFPVEKEAVGSIDFDEDLSVQVFASYQGKIITAFAQLGDEVHKGEELYTIDSPDLIQAESTLIGAAATLDLTNKELARAKDLYKAKIGVSQRELEQATSDQQTAEGALKAARDAVRVFGKTDPEIDLIVSNRKIDPALVVPSPITGQVTSRSAQPGLLVQPGATPAPYSVADVSTKWMLANVTESESPLFHTGQPVKVSIMALPDRKFEGKISAMGAVVDPNSHRVMVRSDVLDPKHELRPGMLATFVIEVKDPVVATALPANGVVREGDGTMTAWVTTDRHHFTQRKVILGLQKNGHYQILKGVERGELAVTDGAVFLSNMLEAEPAD